MKRKYLLLSGVIAASIIGSAGAQVAPPNTSPAAGARTGATTGLGTGVTGSGFADPRAAGTVFNSSTQFQFVPGVGFVPSTGAFPTAVSPSVTFNPALDIVPGFGTGFGFGPWWSGPLVDVRGAWTQRGPMMRGTGWNGTGVPTLGMNVAVAGPAGRPIPNSRLRVKMTTDRGGITERVAGSMQETRPVSAEQFRLANQVTDVMDDRPLTEGRVTALGATAATVSYMDDDIARTRRVPVDEVFFFKGNGDLASAATAPERIDVGDRVLIPVPAEIRQSVAGSRQELSREGGVTVRPSTRAKVSGSRQSTRRMAR